ncbi:transposase [Ideonella sp.]|uniref:transposase n=1 Tax=Ideonella sp. TaxID=1929293 RepID=UPI0039C89235
MLSDNRHGLVVNVRASQAYCTAERDIAAQMLADAASPGKRVTVGADKAYDTRGFVKACRELKVTPQVAQNTKRRGGSAIDERTTHHAPRRIRHQHAGEKNASSSASAGPRPLANWAT